MTDQAPQYDAMHAVHRDDQRDAEFVSDRGHARRLAVALAEDVAAYRETLVAAGIGDELLDDLTRQFAAMWFASDGDDDAPMAGVSIVLGGGGDE